MKMHNLFGYQRSLMEKLKPVEIELGYRPPKIPLDLTQRRDQDWFRLMSWYLVEEIAEVLNALEKDIPEELADALHFAIELGILAGCTPDDVELHRAMDNQSDLPLPYGLTDVIAILGGAVNLLKAKHWKRKPQDTDPQAFRNQVALTIHALVRVIEVHGLDPETIYIAKHKENEDRIKRHY